MSVIFHVRHRVCVLAIHVHNEPLRRSSSNPLTSNTADTVDDIVDHLLANGVVTTGVVVGSILLAADQKLGVEQRAVAAGSDLIDGGRVEINKDGSGHVFAAAGLGEEGLVGAWVADVLDVGIGSTIGAKTVLEEVAKNANQLPGSVGGGEGAVSIQLPSAVTQLGTGLT